MHNPEKRGVIMRRILGTTLLFMLVWCLHPAAPAAKAAIFAHDQLNTTITHSRTAAISPSCLNDPLISSKVWTLAISDTLAFLGDNNALTILDISDPSRPTCRSHLALPWNGGVMAIAV